MPTSSNPLKDSIAETDVTAASSLNKFGIFDAIVEYNADPLQLGRVIVRVPLFHRDDYGVDKLPWARPCSPFGGGPGYGTYMIPPVGSRVWVMFESGNSLFPVWMGTWVSNPVADRKMLRDTLDEYPKGPVSMAPIPGTPWTAPATPGLPKEAQLQTSHRPEIYVPFKSPKGASIIVDDRDGKESLTISDRLGQIIKFDGPVSIGANYNNNSARGTKNAQSGDGVAIERTQSKEGRILIADVGGQSIEFISKQNPKDVAAQMPTVTDWAGSIRISSKQPSKSTGSTETKGGPTETEGKNAVVVELSGSDNKLTIDLSLDGTITTSVHIDAASGSVTIDTPNNITLKSSHIKLEGDVSVTGSLTTQNVQITKDLIVNGKVIN